MLPILKKAGVVDSGAAGLVYLFDGMLKVAQGKSLSCFAHPYLRKALLILHDPVLTIRIDALSGCDWFGRLLSQSGKAHVISVKSVNVF
mgnify:CR=1 FL=1